MRTRPLCVALLLAMLAVASVGPAHAQGPYTWIALDSFAEGTPPTIVVLTSSNPLQTVLDVTIHGFYYETITEQTQVFRRLGLGKFFRQEALYRTAGRPELPAIVHEVGALVGVQPQPEPPLVTVLDEVTIPNADIYPFQPPGKDHEGDPPPPFQWDQSFYQQASTPYPAVRAAPRGLLGRWAGLEVAAAESYPFRAIPATHQLKVARHYQIVIPHAGTQIPQTLVITRRQGAQFQRLLQNWTVVQPFRPLDFTTYRGDYLFVTAPFLTDAIQPLVDQKRARGYRVTVATTDDTGNSCFFIREYIHDWWAADPTRDHYVLLVGMDAQIPLCSDENGQYSDRIYGCVDGLSGDGFPDPLAEAHIGRLPCQNNDECEDMVTKILNYERGYSPADTWLGNVLLTAHKEVWDGLYKLCQQLVANHNYPNPPTFIELYGGDGATNADVKDAVEAGVGIVCYRGHGTAAAWAVWDLAGEDFGFVFPFFIDNLRRTPVVFSIACQNNRVPFFVCIGRDWLKDFARRAVAHFGASEDTWTEANHLLDLELFRAIYDDGFAILSDVTDAATAEMVAEFPSEGEQNAWSYLTLGDPELKIWSEPPQLIVAQNVPAQVPTGNGALTIRVMNNTSSLAAARAGRRGAPATAALVDTNPVPLAIVSVHKAGEVAASYYTNPAGEVTIPIDPVTPGPLALTVYTELDPRGGVLDTIMVYDPAGVPGGPAAGGAGGLHLSAPRPSPFRDRTAFAFRLPARGAVRLAVYDVTGTRVRTLVEDVVEAGEHRAEWDGMDGSGAPAGAGLYFIRLASADGNRALRVVRLR